MITQQPISWPTLRVRGRELAVVLIFAMLTVWLAVPARAQVEPEAIVTADVAAASPRLDPSSAASPKSSSDPAYRAGEVSVTVTAAVDLRAPPRRDEIVVQIGALDSVNEARSLLAGVPDLRAGTFQGRIQPAIEGERIYYRALVAGFSNRSQAARFCGDVIRSGGACFVR